MSRRSQQRRGGSRGSSVSIRGWGRGHGREGDPGASDASRRSGDLRFIPSVSRNSGLQAEGDMLKNHKVQEDFWQLIRDKLNTHWEKYERKEASSKLKSERLQRESRDNVLILIRKLREGIVASNRADAFALEVYEASLHIAIIFTSALHTNATLGYLLPMIYQGSSLRAPSGMATASALDVTTPPGSTPARLESGKVTLLLSLLHHLAQSFPAQRAFLSHLREIPVPCLAKDSPARHWVVQVAHSLRTRNFVHYATLTREDAYKIMVHRPIEPTTVSGCPHALLPAMAFDTLVSLLSIKARQQTWSVIRSAYKEFGCHATSHTGPWLRKILALGCDIPVQDDDRTNSYLREWLSKREKEGEIQLKAGASDRWVVLTPR